MLNVNSINSQGYVNKPFELNTSQQVLSGQAVRPPVGQVGTFESPSNFNSIISSQGQSSLNLLMNRLMEGVVTLILNAVNNLLGKLGLSGDLNTKTANAATQPPTTSVSSTSEASSAQQPEWLEKGSEILTKGFEVLSTLFGGKLGALLGSTGLGGKIINKAKDWIGKIF